MERIKLKTLIKDFPLQAVKGSLQVKINGITAHSKQVAPGNLFVAKKGLNYDGNQFIQEAVDNGAVAILTDLYDPFHPNVVQLITKDVAKVEAWLAKEYYGQASDHLFLVGITGTNGKTTVSYLIHHLFTKLKESCGLIGTIEWRMGGDYVLPSQKTTPDSLTNHKLLHEMLKRGCQSCVMEVSSHALDQDRVASIEFDIAILTNLTQDHLDYHETMHNYVSAKAKLFSSLSKEGVKPFTKQVVINRDASFQEEILASCHVPILTYGIENSADLMAKNIQLTSTHAQFDLVFQDKLFPCRSPLIGRYNVYNLLAAIRCCLAKGYSIENILHALKSFKGVPGRLEKVENEKKLSIFVDYAHTDDALFNVLTTLRELNPRRIITVFGCGGDRDRSKRPKMGAVAEALSDLTILTNDNPRHEDPNEIIRQILSGVSDLSRTLVIADRKEAIEKAVLSATKDDIVLIAGKGHETYQIFSSQTRVFDDRVIAKAAASCESSCVC